MPTPQTPFSTHPMPSKHISHSANTSNPLFNCPHALKTHFTQCQHLKTSFQLPPCPQNIFHTVPTPQTPFSTDPMPSKHISPNANTSNPLFNCPHALKTYFTQCQHLKPPFQLPPCPVCRLLVGSHKSPVWAIEVANSVIGWDGWAAGNKQKCSTSTEPHCTHACAHTHHPTSKTKAQARLS